MPLWSKACIRDDCIITIQTREEKNRTAKCIIIKVNYTIQDVVKRRQVYTIQRKKRIGIRERKKN